MDKSMREFLAAAIADNSRNQAEDLDKIAAMLILNNYIHQEENHYLTGDAGHIGFLFVTLPALTIDTCKAMNVPITKRNLYDVIESIINPSHVNEALRTLVQGTAKGPLDNLSSIDMEDMLEASEPETPADANISDEDDASLNSAMIKRITQGALASLERKESLSKKVSTPLQLAVLDYAQPDIDVSTWDGAKRKAAVDLFLAQTVAQIIAATDPAPLRKPDHIFWADTVAEKIAGVLQLTVISEASFYAQKHYGLRPTNDGPEFANK